MARAGWNQCGLPGTAPPAPICHLKTSEADRTDSRRGGAALLVRSGGRDTQAPSLHPPEAGQPGLHAPRPRPPTPELPGPQACQPPGNGNPKRQSPHAKLMTPPNFFLKRAALAFSVLPLPCRGNFRFLDGKVWPRKWAPGFGSSLSHFPRLRFSHLQNKQDDLGPVGLKETLHLNDLAKGLVPDKEPRGREWGWRWQR